MQTTIKTYRKRKLNVGTAKQRIMLRKDAEKHRTEEKSKSSTAKNAISSLRMTKAFLECVTLAKQLLFQ